jgi:P4 family phage/plasmid primase-like protien
MMELYQRHMEDPRTPPLHLTEMHRSVGPVLIDLDLRFPIGVDTPIERRWDDGFLGDFLRIYAIEAGKVLQPVAGDAEDWTMTAYVTTKPSARVEKGVVKDGLHIVMPDVVTQAAVQHVIRDAVVSHPEFERMLASLGVSNKAGDVFDEAVIDKNGWLMYGSSKPSGLPYCLEHILRIDSATGAVVRSRHYPERTLERLTVEGLDDVDVNLVEALSIRNKYEATHRVREDAAGAVESIELRRAAQEEARAARARRTMASSTAGMICGYERTQAQQLDEDMARALMGLLRPDRADNYHDWIRVGWALFSVGPSTMLDAWLRFSAQSDKYDEDECRRLWTGMRKEGLGLGSLRFWAKEDNPEEYARLVSASLEQLTYDCRSKGELSVARVIYELTKGRFACEFRGRQVVWYVFERHHWRCVDSINSNLLHAIDDVVRKHFAEAAKMYTDRARDEEDPAKSREHAKTASALIDVMASLRNAVPLGRYIEMASTSYFHSEKFEERLDTNPRLIGFTNGVYDIERHEFRACRPGDMISRTTGYDYVPFSASAPEVAEISEFIRKILQDDDVREYGWYMLAQCLDGMKRSEKFFIYTGSGSNGKSRLILLLNAALGEYAGEMSVANFTQDRPSPTAATPEIDRLVGRRLVFTNETEGKEKLNMGYVKEMTGCDRITSRGLFKNTRAWVPQWSIVMCSNYLPKIPRQDHGTWRRIVAVPFDTRFVLPGETLDPSDPRQVRACADVQKSFPRWAPHMMAMLLERLRVLDTELDGTYPEPVAIVRQIEAYRTDNDPVRQFLNDAFQYDPTGNPEAFVRAVHLFRKFRHWAMANNDRASADMPRPEFDGNVVRVLRLPALDKRARGGLGVLGLVEVADVEEEDDGLF